MVREFNYRPNSSRYLMLRRVYSYLADQENTDGCLRDVNVRERAAAARDTARYYYFIDNEVNKYCDYLQMTVAGGGKMITAACVYTINGCIERRLDVEPQRSLCGTKLCLFCCQRVCKTRVGMGVFPPKSVCQYARPYVCLCVSVCVCARRFTLKETAGGGGCGAANPLTILACCGGRTHTHTHRAEPAKRVGRRLRASAALQGCFCSMTNF